MTLTSTSEAVPAVAKRTARQWYVARTKRRRERQAAVVLALREIEHYLPMAKPRGRTRQNSRPEPLFPCYLFVRLDLGTEARRVRYTPGITRLLGGEEGPTPLTDELVEAIHRRVEEHEAAAPRPRFERGERVMIGCGPLEGLEAVFDRRLSGQGRSEVLVKFVNRLVRAKMDESDLIPAASWLATESRHAAEVCRR